MAMPFTVRLRGAVDPGEAEAAIEAFSRELQAADDLFSLWRPDTPMARVALGSLAVDEAPEQIAEVLGLAEQWRERTGGAFDPRLRRRAASRLPVRYPEGAPDPTGIVKTWALARASAHLVDTSAHAWLVGGAGDVAVGGEGSWVVGIADPTVQGDPTGTRPVDRVTLGTDFTALATSGVAQARDHVWDPVTGAPARHYAQVSVAGADVVACDAWATAIVAGGPPTLERAAAQGLAVLAITGARVQGGFEAVATRAWSGVRD